MNPYKRNIKLDYIHIFLRNLNVTHGVWLIYLAAKGFSFFEIGVFESIFHIASLTMEVPTGMIADVFGRKISRVLGVVTYFFYILLLLIGTNAFVIGIGFFLCGLAYTFESGSGEALVYDSLIKTQEQDKYMKIQGIKEILFQLSSTIALFIGGYIAIIKLELNFIIMFFVFTVALIPILLMKETLQKNLEDHRTFKQLMYDQYINSTKTVFSNKKLLFLIFIGALLSAPITTIFFYLQNHLEMLDYKLNIIGIILAIHSLAGGVGGYVAHKLEKKYKEKLILYIIPVFIVAMLWLLYLNQIIFIPFILLGFFDSIFYVVHNDYINRIIPSEQRATILSFSSLAFSLIMIMLFPLVGFLGDLYSLSFAFIVLSVLVSITYLALLNILRKSKLF
jgi:MFS family permease